jgi:hypothetical protein
MAGVTGRAIPRPEDVLGYAVGTERRLPDWHEIVAYFDRLAAASDLIDVERLGTSTAGLPYLAVTISAPENLARRDTLRRHLGRLYDPRGLDAATEQRIVEDGKVTAFFLCTQHSNELGAALMTLELAADLASGDDPETLDILENVVTVIVPTHNPDGHQMIVEWYRRWLDTPYEGQPMPWLYHPYVGHDNNRDWFMLTQVETRLYAALHNREHPQLVFDMHQMGRDGARFMVPPFIDPLDPNQDPVIQQGFADLGTAIATRLTAAGKAGVATNIIFDNYSPSLAYGNYHGSVDLLSEAASVRLATSVTIEEDKLKVERGFDPRKRTWNHPMPWQGGAWTLRDIVEYDRLAALAFLEHAARNRRQWLRNYAGIMRRTVEREYGPGKSAFAFLIPRDQDDPVTTFELLETLALGGVEVEQAQADFTADGVEYPAGTSVIRLGQPAGNFAKTLLEVQDYPDLRRWPDGPPAPPYDIAGHTLPLQMGVRCIQVERPFDVAAARLSVADPVRPRGTLYGADGRGWTIAPQTNAAVLAVNRLLGAGHEVLRLHAAATVDDRVLAPGTYVVPFASGMRETLETLSHDTGIDAMSFTALLDAPLARLRLPRIGIYQSWRPAIDEGWLRWILEHYAQPYQTLHDADIRQGRLRDRFDTIVLPQQKPEDILKGNPEKNDYKEPYPPEYVGGLGQLGVDALIDFVEHGGTLVALDSACDFAIKHLYLPVRNVVEGLPEEEFYCPGSLLRLLFDDPGHPLAFGMQRHAVALFMKSPVFEPVQRGARLDDRVRVVGSYPLYEPNLSGWILGADKLAGKAALVEVSLGRGRVVLVGFRAHFRAQARGTYRVLFNALQPSVEEWVELG